MRNYSSLQSMQYQYESYVQPLLDMIESRGGVVARGAYFPPEQALKLAYDDSECYWIRDYFGSFSSWDEVVNYAMTYDKALNSNDKLTQAMQRLISNLQRQKSDVRRLALQTLDESLSANQRLIKAAEIWCKHDDCYSSDLTDPQALSYYRDYQYKFSPLSTYTSDLWLHNVQGYSVTRPVTFDSEDLSIIADITVALQRRFGIIEAAGTLRPAEITATQVRARENNPHNAHSLPTMTNGKSDEAVKEQLRLAEEYKQNYTKLKAIPFVGNRRVQQGGNVLREIMSIIHPEFDSDLELISPDQVIDCLRWAWSNRPHYNEYMEKEPENIDASYAKWVLLPEGEEERRQLVLAGMHDECILLRFPSTVEGEPGEWKFKGLLEEACVWKTFSDSDLPDELIQKYPDRIYSKNRPVFAGSGPTTLVQESFTHVFKDFIKQYSRSHGSHYLSDAWHEPTGTRANITDIWAVVNHQPTSDGRDITYTPLIDKLFAKLSGDDKSSFDQFQSYTIHTLFNCCFSAPLFREEYHDLMRYLALQTLCGRIVTFDGLYCFSEIMPSGHGTTNDQDSVQSLYAGVHDISFRSKTSPEEVLQAYDDVSAGVIVQGDDVGSPDTDEGNEEQKQSTFTKWGLVMSLKKSLINKRGFEFIRLYSSGDYRFKDPYSQLDLLCSHSPLPHGLVKVFFAEEQVKKPLAVEEIGHMMRLNNFSHHPDFVDIIQDCRQLTKLKLGTEPMWYVPDYMLKSWREAGEPRPPSDYHVWISCPADLNDIAAREAEAKGVNLWSLVSSWQAQQYGEGKFEDLWIVRVCDAINEGAAGKLDEIRSFVYPVVYDQP